MPRIPPRSAFKRYLPNSLSSLPTLKNFQTTFPRIPFFLLLCQSYLSFYTFSVLSYWRFLIWLCFVDPRNGSSGDGDGGFGFSYDTFGVVCAIGLFVVMPVSFYLLANSSHCQASTTTLTSRYPPFSRINVFNPMILQGVFTPLFILLTLLNNNTKYRTICATLSSLTCLTFHLQIILGTVPQSSFVSTNYPFTLVLGLILLVSLRIAWASLILVVDDTGDVWWDVVNKVWGAGVCAGATIALYYWNGCVSNSGGSGGESGSLMDVTSRSNYSASLELSSTLDRDEILGSVDEEEEEEDEEEKEADVPAPSLNATLPIMTIVTPSTDTNSNDSNASASIHSTFLPPAAILLASTFTLTTTYFTTSGALPKYIGEQPFRYHTFCNAIGLISVMITSLLIPGQFKRHELVIGTIGGMLLGLILLFFFQKFTGAVIIAAALPPMWEICFDLILEQQALLKPTHRKRTISKFLLLTGFITLLMNLSYTAVFFYKKVPLLGNLFGGKSNVWAMCVILLQVFSIFWGGYVTKRGHTTTGKKSKAVPMVYFYAMVLVFVLVTVPCIAYRATIPSKANATSETSIKVMTYNNQNGYTTSGHFNGKCYSSIIEKINPDYIAIPSGDSLHSLTGNRDAVEYVSSVVRLHTNYGPGGSFDTFGIAAMSNRRFHADDEPVGQGQVGRIVKLPKSKTSEINRFMLVDSFVVNDVTLTIASAHLNYHGNPEVQTRFIVEYFSSYDFEINPVILLGDFNIEPGGSNAESQSSGIDAFGIFKDDGWSSATPFDCEIEMDEFIDLDDHVCKSSYSTTLTSPSGSFPRFNYQTDYILYKGSSLKLGDVVNELGRIGRSGEDVFCSGHAVLMAGFNVGVV